MKRRRLILVIGATWITWPMVALAQQTRARARRIAVLATNERHLPEFDAFRQQLQQLGYVEGSTLLIEWRYAERGPSQLPHLAEELVASRPEVLISVSTPATLALQKLSPNIPIVFTNIGDPVAAGFATSLARPGGNLTGQSVLAPELSAKRLAILRETIPSASTVAVIWNPTNLANRQQHHQVEQVAAAMGIRLVSVAVSKKDDIAAAFEMAKKAHADALIVLPDPLTGSYRFEVIALAEKARIPTMYGYREYADAGGFISYGPSYPAMFRRTAMYVDRILKGAVPADLPVDQPERFELVINLKTARALGVEISQTLLLRADALIQ